MIEPASPYYRLPSRKWLSKTQELLDRHPLGPKEAVEVVLKAWDDILRSGFGEKPFRIGVDLFPKPQVMAFFLHELVPLELGLRHPGVWRGDQAADEKDLVYIPAPEFSLEVKTSSHPSSVFGNRSYAQKPRKASGTKKSKSGYCLTVNFEKFTAANPSPRITAIRFGWLDHSDWIGQSSATGQQAHLSPLVANAKLLTLYRIEAFAAVPSALAEEGLSESE